MDDRAPTAHFASHRARRRDPRRLDHPQRRTTPRHSFARSLATFNFAVARTFRLADMHPARLVSAERDEYVAILLCKMTLQQRPLHLKSAKGGRLQPSIPADQFNVHPARLVSAERDGYVAILLCKMTLQQRPQILRTAIGRRRQPSIPAHHLNVHTARLVSAERDGDFGKQFRTRTSAAVSQKYDVWADSLESTAVTPLHFHEVQNRAVTEGLVCEVNCGR